MFELNSPKLLEKAFDFLALAFCYLISRSIFIAFSFMINSFYSSQYVDMERRVFFVTNTIDMFYWVAVTNLHLLKKEPLLWRLVWFYFAEWFVLLILTVIIMAIIGA